MNLKIVDEILKQLASYSVETICLCPGGRNAPFVVQLEKSKGFEILSFYDERSAGFFALGRARRDERPVAIITTSGTAVTEVMSSVVEATYSRVPLIIISADRPKRLRGTGAPQTINQKNIFGEYVEACLDIEAVEEFNFDWKMKKPLHINVCFDEPLIDEKNLSQKVYTQKEVKDFQKSSMTPQQLSKPLVVLGSLNPLESKHIEALLSEWQGPIYAESLSGLKKSKQLQKNILKSSEKIVSQLIKTGDVDSIIRIGDIPVGRFWRDLDSYGVPTLSISSKPYKGMVSGELICVPLVTLQKEDLKSELFDWSLSQEKDQKKRDEIDQLLNQHSMSEPSCYKKLSQLVSDEDAVFLGNSLPVRVWDMVSESGAQCWASRGVNGIDGQVSTGLGLVQPFSKNWIFLGDLTTLYDFSGFWMTEYLKKIEAQVNFVVMNNKGGQIFSRIFESSLFLNKHDISFEHFAKTWGWNYVNPKEVNAIELKTSLNFIEINPDPIQTESFWEGYDQLWKK